MIRTDFIKNLVGASGLRNDDGTHSLNEQCKVCGAHITEVIWKKKSYGLEGVVKHRPMGLAAGCTFDISNMYKSSEYYNQSDRFENSNEKHEPRVAQLSGFESKEHGLFYVQFVYPVVLNGKEMTRWSRKDDLSHASLSIKDGFVVMESGNEICRVPISSNVKFIKEKV